jgi:hypothetical protein
MKEWIGKDAEGRDRRRNVGRPGLPYQLTDDQFKDTCDVIRRLYLG